VDSGGGRRSPNRGRLASSTYITGTQIGCRNCPDPARRFWLWRWENPPRTCATPIVIHPFPVGVSPPGARHPTREILSRALADDESLSVASRCRPTPLSSALLVLHRRLPAPPGLASATTSDPRSSGPSASRVLPSWRPRTNSSSPTRSPGVPPSASCGYLPRESSLGYPTASFAPERLHSGSRLRIGPALGVRPPVSTLGGHPPPEGILRYPTWSTRSSLAVLVRIPYPHASPRCGGRDASRVALSGSSIQGMPQNQAHSGSLPPGSSLRDRPSGVFAPGHFSSSFARALALPPLPDRASQPRRRQDPGAVPLPSVPTVAARPARRSASSRPWYSRRTIMVGKALADARVASSGAGLFPGRCSRPGRHPSRCHCSPAALPSRPTFWGRPPRGWSRPPGGPALPTRDMSA